MCFHVCVHGRNYLDLSLYVISLKGAEVFIHASSEMRIFIYLLKVDLFQSLFVTYGFFKIMLMCFCVLISILKCWGVFYSHYL